MSLIRKVVVLCFLSAIGVGPVSPHSTIAADDDVNFGPIYSRDTTLEGDRRVRLLGPLFEQRTSTNGRVVKALRPLFTRSIEANGRDNRTDLLWPLATATTVGKEVNSRFATMYYTDYDSSDPMSRWRLWLLPVLFMGRDAAGSGYFAVFPLGGKVSEILFFDRFWFFLFPVYAHYASEGQHTTDIMWPIISWSRGKGVLRARIFPIYGRTIHPGVSESMFLMWPILTWARYVKPEQKGGGFVLFPFIGRIHRPQATSWLLLPPLIRWTRGQDYQELNLPWPFVQISSGRINRFNLWPLGGGRSEPGVNEGFILWPIVRSYHSETGSQTFDSLAILPFLQYAALKVPDSHLANSNMVFADKSLKIWPLFVNRTVGGVSRVKIPALWPSKDIEAIDNTYAPVWTLFSRTDTSDSSDSELLWGLIRRRTGPAGAASSIFPLISWKRVPAKDEIQDWSFLLGLIGYRKEGSHGSLRLLFMDFGGRKTVEKESTDAGAVIVDPVPQKQSAGD